MILFQILSHLVPVFSSPVYEQQVVGCVLGIQKHSEHGFVFVPGFKNKNPQPGAWLTSSFLYHAQIITAKFQYCFIEVLCR